MNERIKQLTEQAHERKPLMVINPQTFEPVHKIDNDGVPMYHKVFNQEKFAELIVRECAKAAYLYASDSENYEHYDDNGWDCLPGDLQSHIKEHFGVEE